jgi:hypothetical protein
LTVANQQANCALKSVGELNVRPGRKLVSR